MLTCNHSFCLLFDMDTNFIVYFIFFLTKRKQVLAVSGVKAGETGLVGKKIETVS